MNTENTRTKIRCYEDLIVWQKSMELVTRIYKFSASFPKEEMYGLTNQMRRAAVSIPSNIAEGFNRSTRRDYRSFLYNAYGSGSELKTQLTIGKSLGYGTPNAYGSIFALLEEVLKILNTLIRKLA